MTKPKDAPAAPPAEIIPPAKGAKSGKAKAALAKLGLVDPNAAERDPELEGLMHEIEADMREEELRKIWQRYGTAFIVGLVLVVLAVGGLQMWRDHQAAQRLALAASYDQAMQDLRSGKTAEGLDGLAKVASHTGEGYAAVADLQRAAVLLKQNDIDGAVAVYKALAENAKIDDAFRQLATILEVLHTMDRAPPNILEAKLTPLLTPGSPFSPTALELSAVLAMKQGDPARAIKLLDQILEGQNMPPDLLARAKDMRTYYTSQLPSAPSVAKTVPDKP